MSQTEPVDRNIVTGFASSGSQRWLELIALLAVLAINLPTALATITTTGDISPTYNGVDDPWDAVANLIVSNTAPGTMTIGDGSTVSNDYSYIGNQSGSTGAVTVVGTGSTWAVNNRIYVGHNGSGELITLNGGLVSAKGVYLGKWEGSSGTATIIGPGSAWNVSDFLFVGEYGQGALLIENGAKVGSEYRVILGAHDGATGTATVTGAGSSWSHNGEFNLGWENQGEVGTLNIRDNASVDIGGFLKMRSSNSTVNLDSGTLRLYDSGFVSPFPMPPPASITGGRLNFTGGRLEGVKVIGLSQQFIQQGGVLAPGNSIGETFIGGDFILSAGVLEIEVGGEENTHDLLESRDDIEIQANGMTLDLRSIGPMAAGTYTIIQTSKGTLTGTFGSITGLGMYEDLVDVLYTSNAVMITFFRDYVPGDLDGDGFVGITDLNRILSNWDKTVPAGSWIDGDTSGDGFVGIEDLNVVLSNWNAGTPPGEEVLANVPEPGAVGVFGLLAAGMMGRRGRRV